MVLILYGFGFKLPASGTFGSCRVGLGARTRSFSVLCLTNSAPTSRNTDHCPTISRKRATSWKPSLAPTVTTPWDSAQERQLQAGPNQVTTARVYSQERNIAGWNSTSHSLIGVQLHPIANTVQEPIIKPPPPLTTYLSLLAPIVDFLLSPWVIFSLLFWGRRASGYVEFHLACLAHPGVASRPLWSVESDWPAVTRVQEVALADKSLLSIKQLAVQSEQLLFIRDTKGCLEQRHRVGVFYTA